jgi:hypothetical protein
MKFSHTAVCVMALSVLLLWFPSGNGDAATDCQAVANNLWGQWMNGTLPRNDATIANLLKMKQDCPQSDKSWSAMVNEIKAQREKVAEAVAIVKMAVEMLTHQPASTGQEGNQ